MTILIRAAAAAIVVACLIPAIPAAAQQRSIVTARVRHVDLDLSTPTGQQAFDRRVATAARRTCGLMGPVSEMADAMRCFREMRNDGRVQMASVMARRSVQLASAR